MELELIYNPEGATQSSKVLGYSLTVPKFLIKPRPGSHGTTTKNSEESFLMLRNG